MLILAAGALAWRLLTLESMLGSAAACQMCISKAAATADAPFWIAWLMILWLSYRVPRVWPGRILRVIIALALLIYLLDTYVLANYTTRLYLSWVTLYASQPKVVLQHVANTHSGWVLGSMLAVSSLTVIFIWHRPRQNLASWWTSTTAILALAFVPFLFAGDKLYYVHAWATRNVFTANQIHGLSRPYSSNYLERAFETLSPQSQCSQGDNRRRDVIVLILESWSAYHSPLWGGYRDWTPGLDLIAKEHTQFAKFIGGGYNTNHGLMSILAGTPVLAPLSSLFTRVSFDPAWGWPHSLPAQLGRAGYFTAFLTSGDLSFTGKGNWLRHLGFDEVEGHMHPSYRGLPRIHFNAAPDAALYRRAIQYWRAHPVGQPLALVIESVSSHNPFMHPLTRESGEEQAIRYMARTAADFQRTLTAKGFFSKGGLLIMVSDHRAMTAVSPEEFEVIGTDAAARVPMVVIASHDTAGTVTTLTHQADIAPSIAALMTPQGCGYPGWQSLFKKSPESQQRCVFHARGDDWGLLEVVCTDGQGTVRLAGDDSHFVNVEDIQPNRQQELLHEIAVLRYMAHQHTRAHLAAEHYDNTGQIK